MHFLKAFLLEVNEFWFNHFWRKLTFWKGWDFQSELFCMKENLVVSILFFEPLFFHLHTFACAKNGILDRINELRLESGKYSVWKYYLARCMRLILILYWNQGRFVDSGIFVFKHIFDRGFWFIYFKSTIILHNFTLISMKLFFQAENDSFGRPNKLWRKLQNANKPQRFAITPVSEVPLPCRKGEKIVLLLQEKNYFKVKKEVPKV